MKGSKLIAQTIRAVAAARGLDLSKVGSHARIDNPPYMPLCIEVIGPNLISIAHYGLQNGDLMADPEMVFSMGVGSTRATHTKWLIVPPCGISSRRGRL
jgi:hypothetical protein